MSVSFNSALVICTRRIGDVLLATPVVRALRLANPTAAIDMLVFEGTQGVVTANPDLRTVLTIEERPGLSRHIGLIRRIWRRYDLAVSLLSGDRPTLYAWAAGRTRVGTLDTDSKSRWKRSLLDYWVAFDNLNTHTVTMNLRVVEQAGITRRASPVVSWNEDDEEAAATALAALDSDQPFAVLHLSPKYAYKTWTEDGWRELAKWLNDRGVVLLVAGGGAPQEQQLIDSILCGFPENTVNLAGKLGLGALAFVLSRSVLYVGTDTAVTHMAAALNVPTVALFGPSNPVKWGPWPHSFDSVSSPWEMRGSARVGNVHLVQGQKHCVPCLLEGCDRHEGSLSDCLQQLSAQRVIDASEDLLAGSVGPSERSIAQ